jgi:uncharacterized sulfatase
MTDSQRWDMVNCYRSTGLKTPNLDRLASAGVRFERAYTCSPVCGPARAGLFTGTWPHTNGSWSNGMPLGEFTRTIGMRTTNAGIHSAFIGKWHLDASDYFGLGQCPPGWDPAYWYDMRNYLDELSPEDRVRSRQTETVLDDPPAEMTYGHRCTNRAVDFIQKHKDEDFFLVVSYDEPHGPYLCPKKFRDMYANYEFPLSPNVHDSLEDKPEHVKLWAGQRLHQDSSKVRVIRPEYFGCNTFVDEEIGLVVYTSDHGHMEQSHRLYIKGPAMYDEIARIPFIMRWPGHAPKGAVCKRPVSHIDVAPTILEFFGIEVSRMLAGQSMLATFRKPLAQPAQTVFCEFHRYEVDQDGFGAFQPIRCAFDGRYKLVINLMTSDELYDLETDPGEMKNQITNPELAAARNRLHDQILDWMNRTRDPFRGWYWERRPWRTDAAPVTDWHYTYTTRQRESEPGELRMLDYNTGVESAKLTVEIPRSAPENK